MDKYTKAYRKSEFESVSMHSTYKPSLKIIGQNGEQTKWLAITNEELFKIAKFLTIGK